MTRAAADIVGRIGADRPAHVVLTKQVMGPEPEPAPEPRPPRASGLTGALLDAAACVGFGALAVFVTRGLWPDPALRGLRLNGDDQILTEWFFGYAARVYSGDLGLVTHLLNAPDGVNLLANPSALLLGVLLGPVTLAYGAPVSFAVAVGLNLAATATGWYLLFVRAFRRHRVAAVLGAVVCGFGPGMLAQSNGHLDVTAQWLVPPILAAVAGLVRRAGSRRQAVPAVALGVLVALQYLLSLQVLLLLTVALGVLVAGYMAAAWHDGRRRLAGVGPGLGLAAAVAVPLLAYPVWVQFFGPQHVSGGPFPPENFSLDAAGLAAVSPLSVAGEIPGRLATAEFNAYFGAPLLLVIAGTTLWLWRRPVAVAGATAAAAMIALALGPRVIVDGRRTGIPGPYALLDALPGFSAIPPSRFGLAASALFGMLLVLAVDAGLSTASGLARYAVPVAVLAALAPIAPAPLPTVTRAPVP